MTYIMHTHTSTYRNANKQCVMLLSTEKDDSRRDLAHECLGEVLRVLRQVIATYPMLNTVETLTAAGTLISKVKGQF